MRNPGRSCPDRLPATYHRTHGVRYFHGCYSIGEDTLWGVNRLRKGARNTLAALKSSRAARPDGAPIYVILDNLSAHKGPDIRRVGAVLAFASAPVDTGPRHLLPPVRRLPVPLLIGPASTPAHGRIPPWPGSTASGRPRCASRSHI